MLCADAGLTVGVLGGNGILVRGVLPLPGAGGIIISEDSQRRIHRIHAKSIVRFSQTVDFPNPFQGWRQGGLIPLVTAKKLLQGELLSWGSSVVVLGTGNAALSFASELIEKAQVREVFCLESRKNWGKKDYAGWEVKRRFFEMLGGRVIFGEPVSLSEKNQHLWTLKIRDELGIRVIDATRVISAGPFVPPTIVREYPPGSLLFEMEAVAPENRADDVEGWIQEEESAAQVAAKILRVLSGRFEIREDTREEWRRRFSIAKRRLADLPAHQTESFEPQYEGKWFSASERKALTQFEGVPRAQHRLQMTASIECFENIACDLCEKACPENAIKIQRKPKDGVKSFLKESLCTGCGVCVAVCPSRSIAMIQEDDTSSSAKMVLPLGGPRKATKGDSFQLLNRRGESLGTVRIQEDSKTLYSIQLVGLDVPSHLIWDARAIRFQNTQENSDPEWSEVLANEKQKEKVPLQLNGHPRFVREGISVSEALFEMGTGRMSDALLCPDGSCGLCNVSVDGNKDLACQTRTRRGMVLKTEGEQQKSDRGDLCPCLGIQADAIIHKMKTGALKTPEAILAHFPVGQGKCHGQLCMAVFRRLMIQNAQTPDVAERLEQWIDWRFPWAEWTIQPGASLF